MISVEAVRPAGEAGAHATTRKHRRREADYEVGSPFDRRTDGDQLRRLAERTRADAGTAVAIPEPEFEALAKLAQDTCGVYGFNSPLDGAYIEVRAYVVRRWPWSRPKVAWQVSVMDSEASQKRFRQLHLDTDRRMAW